MIENEQTYRYDTCFVVLVQDCASGTAYAWVVFKTPRNLFRTLAFAEAVSWTLLIAGLIIRAITDWAPAVTIGGGIHGFVFLTYSAVSILVAKNQRWSFGAIVLVLFSAIIPYATIPVEVWAAKKNKLVGHWRTEQTEDPRDAQWHDRLLRLVLNHPVIFGVLLSFAVVGLYIMLLILGPPGG